MWHGRVSVILLSRKEAPQPNQAEEPNVDKTLAEMNSEDAESLCKRLVYIRLFSLIMLWASARSLGGRTEGWLFMRLMVVRCTEVVGLVQVVKLVFLKSEAESWSCVQGLSHSSS